MRRFVNLADIHIGWEHVVRNGQRRKRVPTFSEPALCAVMRFIEDFAPDTVVLSGDQVNFGPISHWNKGRPILTEDLRLRDEYDELDRLVLAPVQPAHTKIWHDGNHEQWVRDFVAESPGIEGLVEPESYLDLVQRGWRMFSQGEISNVGKLYFVHGDVVFRNGGGVNPAKKLVQYYRRNIRAGHIHTYAAYTDYMPVDMDDFHSGVIVPALSTRNPAYVKNGASNHMQGFNYGFIHDDGSFNDYVVIIYDDTFTVGGKRYHGRA